jgi:hypothetical protein
VGGTAWRPSPRQLDPGALLYARAEALDRLKTPRQRIWVTGVPSSIKEVFMLRDIILWLAGVPIFVIILMHLFGVFH